MATGTSFKQQCPSCEAMVPIRDEGLIGRKIDCPKCKYRFVVEEPEAVEEEAPAKKKGGKSEKEDKGGKGGPRKKGADKAKSKTQGGSPVMLYGGIALAVLAVGGLIVGGIILMSGGDTPPSNITTPPSGQVGTPGGGEGENPTPPVTSPTATKTLPNVTNLLPNDSQVVVSYPMKYTAGSDLKLAADEEGGFRSDHFADKMGFQLADINRLVSAVNVKDDWVFTVLQTKAAYNKDQLTRQLELVAQPPVQSKSGKALTAYQINGELDNLSNFLLKMNKSREVFQVHFYDANTLVFADPAAMQRFLKDDCKPKYLSEEPDASTPPPATTPGEGSNPGGPMSPTKPGGGQTIPMGGPPGGIPGNPMTPGYPMTPGNPMTPGGNQGTNPTPPASVLPPSNYMTIVPDLKAMLERIEKLTDTKEASDTVTVAALMAPIQAAYPEGTSPATAVTGWLTKGMNLPIGQRQLGQVVLRLLGGKAQAGNDPKKDADSLNASLRRIKVVGASIGKFTKENANVTIALDMQSRKEAEEREKTLRTNLEAMLPLAKLGLGLTLSLANGPAGGTNPGQTGQPGNPMFPGAGGFPMGGTGGVSPRPGGGGPGVGVPPRGQGGAGSGEAGFGGTTPGSTGNPMGTGGTGTGTGTDDEDNDGKILLYLVDRTVICNLDLSKFGEAYDKVYVPIKSLMLVLKSEAQIVSTKVRYHDLASALKQYASDKREFPRGTIDRGINPETGLVYRPDQRLSFLATLLPLMGDEYREWKIDATKGWSDQPNLLVATRSVPQFLAHPMPKLNPQLSPARISYPGLSEALLGATHFVGVTGVGMDAAEYRVGDAQTEKKLGIFGYDRVTKKTDVKDGLDKTIAMILVPDDHKSPWLAGGGSTLRAIADESEEANPLASFVCMTYPGKKGETSKFDGKRGTLAIMADGKVRFIPETLPAATFRALCTIAGGEQIDRLDATCPVIEPDVREIKTPTTPPVVPGKPVVTPPAPGTGTGIVPPGKLPPQGGAPVDSPEKK